MPEAGFEPAQMAAPYHSAIARQPVDRKDIEKFRDVQDILTVLKFTLNKYRPLTVMYRISFERPRRKSMTPTCTNFNREHAGVTHVNVCEFRNTRRIFTEVIVRTNRQLVKYNSYIYHFQQGTCWGDTC
jgi:hypothetical protein